MPLDPDTLARVYGRHPARTMPFDELYAGLRAQLAAGNVVRAAEGPLELYLYSNRCIFERNWNLFSLISRGLVVEPAARRVVATPFPKFFNYGEFITDVPEEPFEATDKVDGSLVALFHHGGAWRATTKGAFRSGQAEWATRFLNTRLSPGALRAGTTYLCEAIYPGNRIVVNYDFEDLVLLCAYDERGDELGRNELGQVAASAGMRLVASRAFASMDELISTTRALGLDREGFVVRFAGGLRLKLKGEEYLRAHRVMSRCTPLALWESMVACGDLDALRRDLPEEMLTDFDAIRRILNGQLDALVDEVLAAAERLKDLPDKELGQRIQRPDHGLTDVARDFVFACRKCDFRAAAATKGRVRDGLLRRMRPDGNRLAGYAPSGLVTRFQNEST